MLHVLEHTLLDCVKLVPFLFLTYLVMEYLEHKAADKTSALVKKAGKFGPLVGGLAGAFPQCGFSAAAANLYAGRVISMGTLVAIFLSTSDEMLPIMISEQQPIQNIVSFVFFKVVVGVIAGFVIDMVFRKRHKEEEHTHIHEICEQEHCHCETGIFRSAISHTLQITFFIVLITLVLNLLLHTIGEDVLAGFIMNRPVLGPVLAGIVGLIPNCASSVVLTQLYLQNTVGVGTMMAGLLANSGVGLLVLFRVHHHRKENLTILGLLYLIGVVTGIVLELLV